MAVTLKRRPELEEVAVERVVAALHIPPLIMGFSQPYFSLFDFVVCVCFLLFVVVHGSGVYQDAKIDDYQDIFDI
jgi:hypothetical protein